MVPEQHSWDSKNRCSTARHQQGPSYVVSLSLMPVCVTSNLSLLGVDLDVHSHTRYPAVAVPSVSFSVVMHPPIQTADGPSTTVPAELTTDRPSNEAKAGNSAMPCSRLRSGISRSTNRQLLSESANTSHEGAHSKEGGNKQAISAPEGIIENIIDKVKMKTEDINSPVPPLQAVPTSCVAAEEAGSELATWTSILNNIKAFMGVAGQIDDVANTYFFVITF